jgi:ribosome modulation factor
MAKRKKPTRGRRATDHADFTGSTANRRAVERLAASGERKTKRRRKGEGNGSLGLDGGNVGGPSDECIHRHVRDIRGQQARLKSALKKASDERKTLNAYYKSAEGDGMDTAALKKAFKDSDRPMGEVVAERRNIARYEKIMGGPVGTQWSLLDGDNAIALDAYAQGEHAGMNGEPRDNCPFLPGSEDYNRYMAGWQAGQMRLGKEKFGAGPGDEIPPAPPEA